MTEGTVDDHIYRKKVRNGWLSLDDSTDVMHVPGGMVLRSAYVSGVAMVFVPCDAYDRRDWINSQGA